MRLIYDANTGQYIRIVPAKSARAREREKQEPQRRPQPTAKEWEDALNRVNISPEMVAEVNAETKQLVSASATRQGSFIAIQRSTLPNKEGIVRVGIGNPDTWVTLQQGNNSRRWSVIATIIEGYNGAKFPVIAINNHIVPIMGKVIPVRGDFITVVVRQFDALLNPWVTATIETERVQEFEDVRSGDSGPVSFFEASQWHTHFTVSPDGGVLAGDNVLVYSPDTTLISTYPAGEGRLYPLGPQGFKIAYDDALAASPFITVNFYGRK